MTGPHTALARPIVAEGLGTALLVAVVVGSGIAAQRLSPGQTGLQLLENSLATGAGLVALILAFGSVSGAHFNPVVSLVDGFLGGLGWTAVLAYIGAQVVGACVGCMAANLMFDLDAVILSTTTRSSGGIWLAFVAFQLIGGAFAVAVSLFLHPDLDPDDVVVPHDPDPGAMP